MIKINHLTREQCDMMDIIWSFKTKEEYVEWFETLNDREANMARGLMELLCLAIAEEEFEETVDPYREANLVIRNIKSKLTQNK